MVRGLKLLGLPKSLLVLMILFMMAVAAVSVAVAMLTVK